MPQMFPASWIFIYLYVLLSFLLVFLVVSFSSSVKLEGESDEGVDKTTQEGWMW